MLGAIIGDIVGSPYEVMNIRHREDVHPFQKGCRVTDDSILTIAVARAIENNRNKSNEDDLEKEVALSLKDYVKKYPLKCSHGTLYGGGFEKWAHEEKLERREVYVDKNSGKKVSTNGAAMRVASVGWIYSSIEEVKEKAKNTAAYTHNTMESIKAAQAIALSVFTARKTRNKYIIMEVLQRELSYKIDTSISRVEEIKKENRDYRNRNIIKGNWSSVINCNAEKTTQYAIYSFLISNSFEDCIKTAISLGGDSDTIACMAGAIAEAYYGIPKEWEEKAFNVIEKDCKEDDVNFVRYFKNKYCSLSSDIIKFIPHTQESRTIIQNGKCDKIDCLTAVACGAVGAVIDIFMVSAPGAGDIGKWSDKQTDLMVKQFAKFVGWSPKPEQKNNIASAIGYLERNFKVNYDQRYTVDVNGLFDMSTKNHHMISLSHSPDIVGLFFSVLNQFTSTASFVADGQVITIKADSLELQGNDFMSKLFCGVSNWLGHIMSDIAGSSGASGRGTGIVMPFYELFRFCDFGSFSVEKDKQDLATIATRVFQEGYDFRHGIAMSVPVILTDLSIRLIWSIRNRFQYKKELKDCFPNSSHKDLRVMLLLGNGTLCVADGVDAGLRSSGNFLLFCTRLNLVAWYRVAVLVVKEVCIQSGLEYGLEGQIEAYKEINAELEYYLEKLKAIDLRAYEEEIEYMQKMNQELMQLENNDDINQFLLNEYEHRQIDLPWNGNVDEFMCNKSVCLQFK